MKSFVFIATVLLAQAAGPLAGAGETWGGEAGRDKGGWVADHAATETWDQAIASLDPSKAIIPMDDASIVIEVNATDRDAGFQIFLDSAGWRDVRVFSPNGRAVYHTVTWGGLRRIGGGTELYLESEEPEYGSLDELAELVGLMPAGEYRYLATLTNGDYAIGRAVLSHILPAGPKLVSPLPLPSQRCAGVSRGLASIDWEPVSEPIPIPGPGLPRELNIVAYQVVVEDEQAGLGISMTVDPRMTSVTLPVELLRARTEYGFEIIAIEAGGNRTITESCFITE